MDWHGWLTLAVVLLALFAMVREIAAPDLVLMAALLALAVTGTLSPAETFLGFANPVVPAIGALFIVSAGLRETGALDITLGRLLGRAHSAREGTLRIVSPVMGLSGFLNNAPIVAMMTPSVIQWARRNGLSASRFLIPLSYASILGSITTIMGTSTTLTVAGLVEEAGMTPLHFFELLPVAIPVCAVGLLYLIFIAPRLLPDRRDASDAVGDRRREYVATMHVQSDCPLVNQSVEAAGLRRLPGLFLVEINRNGRIITPVSPDEILAASDQLVFAGVVATIIDLQRIRGLVPAPESDQPTVFDPDHRLAEAVVSSSSPLVGTSIRDANFRTVYDAAVIAVHRNAERLGGKIGEIVLRPGDTLLLQCAAGFMRAHRNSPDFYLVNELEGSARPRHERAWLAIGLLLLMVIAVATGLVTIAVGALVTAGALVATRCLTGPQARASVNWSILVIIGAGLGIATAMEKTGAANAIANLVVSAVGDAGPVAALLVVYVLCLVLAEMLHHAAAVAILFPIAVATAAQVGADPRGFVVAVAVAGTCAFASPVTYQTHLIVYGAGAYRFTDFVRAGLPLDIIVGAVAMSVIPWVWAI
ncbi:MAG: SLC13 family permease [Myxococcota bacterium]|nr:SLC13 family permease [Myxococcota bacterium]